MKVSSVTCICFSPTGTTKLIAENISHGFNAKHTQMVDITKRSQREDCLQTLGSDLVILATPVYYGRVPEEAASWFATLTGGQIPAALVVVYGNRAIDDALRELHDIAVGRRFVPIAAGAFVAEHSYSSQSLPIAQGRPDESDLVRARQFGVAIKQKLHSLNSLDTGGRLTVPGKAPYIEPTNLLRIKEARVAIPLTPETDTNLCTQCGECVEMCPTGAISRDDVSQTDRWQCLICFACVKGCPVGARQMRDPFFRAAIEELHRTCLHRNTPEWYL